MLPVQPVAYRRFLRYVRSLGRYLCFFLAQKFDAGGGGEPNSSGLTEPTSTIPEPEAGYNAIISKIIAMPIPQPISLNWKSPLSPNMSTQPHISDVRHLPMLAR